MNACNIVKGTKKISTIQQSHVTLEYQYSAATCIQLTFINFNMIHTYIHMYTWICESHSYLQVGSEYINKLTGYMNHVVWSICIVNGVFGWTYKLSTLNGFCPGNFFGTL
jgi:hypothetical protein